MRRSSTPCLRRASVRRASVRRASAAVAALALLAGGGCVTKQSHDLVVAERDRLAVEERNLEGQVERLTAANEGLSSERLALIDELEDYRLSTGKLVGKVRRLERSESELAAGLKSSRARLAQREAEIASLRGAYEGLVSDLEHEVAAGQIQIERLRSGLQLNLSQDVLFASGSAALDAGGIEVLRKVARRLTGLPHDVEVRGHTDDVPIGSRYPSNWELAAARASSVVRLLAEEGVDPTRLIAVSLGEFEPVDSNETPEGRARNRRIEIRLEQGAVPVESDSEAPDGAGPVESAADEPASAPAGTDSPAVPVPDPALEAPAPEPQASM